jgi:hypothetical protein
MKQNQQRQKRAFLLGAAWLSLSHTLHGIQSPGLFCMDYLVGDTLSIILLNTHDG